MIGVHVSGVYVSGMQGENPRIHTFGTLPDPINGGYGPHGSDP